MRRGVTSFENSSGRDALAWLLLRVIKELSPCTTTSLVAHVSGDIPPAEPGRASHTRKLVLDALLKLEILDFIDSSQEQIVLTDKGRRRRNESAIPASQPRSSYFTFLRPLTLAESSLRLKRLWQDCSAAVRLVTQRVLRMNGDRAERASAIAIQIWKRNAAAMIRSKATTLVVTVTELWSLGCNHADALGILLANWLRPSGALLSTWAKDIRRPQNAKYSGRSWPIIYGAALSVVALSIAGGVTFLSHQSPETAVGASTDWFFVQPERPSSIGDAAEPDAPRKRIGRAEAIVTAPNDIDRQPAEATAAEPNRIEQPAGGLDATPAVTEQITVDPIVATVRAQLAVPALRKRVRSDDLAALRSFYFERNGPALWMTGAGLTARAQAVISEIHHADEWGLSAAAFDLPGVDNLPVTAEAQAREEIKLGLAILQYARSARGGRLSPSRISNLLDERPHLLDPKTVLIEIAASPAPDAYLRSLHPKQEQFERLRQALLRARAESEARGKKPANERDIQLLIINMERWRWMPIELGSYYVWDNIPEFVARVVKHGETIYVEKTIVGQPQYPTPMFSAEMRSIVFNPEWTVPETIIKEDLRPALQHGGFFGGPSTAILEEHGLKVSYAGHPVDANSIDWVNVNIWQYTFTQAPGPDNVLGALKFNFPNTHAIYMHDTVQPELFAETERTLSHGCIRVHEPERLAALLLAEDQGWSAQKVKAMLATGNNSIVMLKRPVPVHLTYFTAVVDEQGEVQTFADIYGLDNKMGSALFGRAIKIQAPTLEVNAQVGQPKSSWRSAEGTGSLADTISGLFGN
jgi:murein L,D-transpeptidase YcbB/YkuD